MIRWTNRFPLFFGLCCLCFLCTCDTAQEASPAPGPFVLTRDSITLTVDASYGGRITSLTYGGQEVLSTLRDSSGIRSAA